MGILECKALLKKFNEKRCTRDELGRLWDIVADRENENQLKDLLLDDLNNLEVKDRDVQSIIFDRILQNIESRLKFPDQEKRTPARLINWEKRSYRQFVRVAAMFLLAFIGGGVISYISFDKTLAPAAVAYNEITAPLGARSEVVLPDGSKVWLNAGSKIRYRDGFNKVNRDILLEGEAYFKVAKNKELPFNVRTGELSIVAVGTEFNVKAYVSEGIIETTLVEGKVSIECPSGSIKKSKLVYLEAHEKAVYVKENRKLDVEDFTAIKQTKPEVMKLKKGIIYVAEKVDPVPIIAWKDNRLIFKGEELNSLLVKLERKYNVAFSFESENIKDFRFTGTLEDETLTQVLDVIKLSAPIEYALDGKTVRISENKQMTKKFSGHLKKKGE